MRRPIRRAERDGISAFFVETDAPGFAVAQKLEKMGFRGSQTAELVFDDCRVPAENLIGAENEGHEVVMSGLDLERALVAPISLGIAERALDARRSSTPRLGNSSASRSRASRWCSRASPTCTRGVEAMRALNYRCLAACNDLEVGAGGRGAIHKLTAATVMYTADSLNAVLDHAVQIHGGMGYIWESEINRLYRTIKLLEIGAGTTEVRKMIIAEELLKEAR